jgi:imidazolonepropionase
MRPCTPSCYFFRNASELITLAPGALPRRGAALGELGIIPRGGLLTDGGNIFRTGPSRLLERQALRLRAEPVDCRGCVVMPGFVDSHTHLVFAASRVNDYDLRIRGRSYEEIAAAGGGIQSSAKKVRHSSNATLAGNAARFLEQMAAHGTTTVEVKSGYGLEPGQELRILRVIRQLQAGSPLELVPTLMALHAVPASYDGGRAEFVKQVVRRLVPAVATGNLAEFIDCFCDRDAFSVEECRRVLAAGKQAGLMGRVHAEQLAHTGAARLAVESGAASADHLDCLSASDIRMLAHSDLIATLLPGANFHLGLARYAPARRLIDSGAAVALATDFNPGTSPTLNMQFILSLACTQMGMSPAQAIAAATLNGAAALRRADRLGSLEPGKQADLIVLDVADHREIPYYFAVNHCVMTVKRGKIVYRRPGNDTSLLSSPGGERGERNGCGHLGCAAFPACRLDG